MNGVNTLNDGGFATIPEINLDLKIVEHNGIKLIVWMERRGGEPDRPRFARLPIPEVEDVPDGYGAAASDYLENVLGFSTTLTMQLMNYAHEYRNRVMDAKNK